MLWHLACREHACCKVLMTQLQQAVEASDYTCKREATERMRRQTNCLAQCFSILLWIKAHRSSSQTACLCMSRRALTGSVTSTAPWDLLKLSTPDTFFFYCIVRYQTSASSRTAKLARTAGRAVGDRAFAIEWTQPLFSDIKTCLKLVVRHSALHGDQSALST